MSLVRPPRGAEGVLAALALAAIVAAPARAQIVEYGPQAVITSAEPAAGTVGAYGALRSVGRMRVAAFAGAGGGADGAAWRAELTGQFLLQPWARRGTGAYLGGGIAAADPGDGADAYLVLLAGIEARPGTASGWAVEVGLGGGLRVAAAWRWRRFPPRPGQRR